MQVVGHQYNLGVGRYRYGFNGKENDNEVKGEGNQQDYGMRIYDPRVGRFLSTDPITKEYPELTPYQYASNSPLQNIDIDGLERLPVTGESITGNLWISLGNLQSGNQTVVESQRKIDRNSQAKLQGTTHSISLNAIRVQSLSCHPDNNYLHKERARIVSEYSKLDRENGQVEFRRNRLWDILLGKRSVGREEIDENGYLTGRWKPYGGVPPDVALGRGGGLSQFESFTSGQISRFIATEEGAQGAAKIESIKNAIKGGDWTIWSERIDAVKYGEQTYILDGHNRLKAISELGGEGKTSVYLMSLEDAMKFYKDKMEHIKKGSFNTPISK